MASRRSITMDYNWWSGDKGFGFGNWPEASPVDKMEDSFQLEKSVRSSFKQLARSHAQNPFS